MIQLHASTFHSRLDTNANQGGAECEKSALFGSGPADPRGKADFRTFFRNLQLENRPVRVTHRRTFLFNRTEPSCTPDSVRVLSAIANARVCEQKRERESLAVSPRTMRYFAPAALFTFIAVFVFLSINIRVRVFHGRISTSVFLFPSPSISPSPPLSLSLSLTLTLFFLLYPTGCYHDTN